MKKIVIAAAAALALISGAAFAQNTGAPANAQTDPAKPGMGNPGTTLSLIHISEPTRPY